MTLLLLGALIVFEGIRRLIDPPDVEGVLVLVVAMVGIGVNLAAVRLIAVRIGAASTSRGPSGTCSPTCSRSLRPPSPAP